MDFRRRNKIGQEILTLDLNQKICLITGANSGIGKAVAGKLAKLGATVVMVCRDQMRGEDALRDVIEQSANKDVHLMLADISSMASVRRLADEFKRKFSRLHVLINNAGVSLLSRQLSADGYEMTFATNHLGPFLLTNLLLDTLMKSSPSRIINVASVSHRGGTVNFDDLMGEKHYDGNAAYSQSKLANIFFTYELARRLKGTGVTVNAMCPGGVATGIWRHFNPLVRGFLRVVLKSAEEAAWLPLYLATAKEMEGASGKYFEFSGHTKLAKYIWFMRNDPRRAEKKSSPTTYDEGIAKRLWEASERLTGLTATSV